MVALIALALVGVLTQLGSGSGGLFQSVKNALS
jgi:Flp pilus assembly pilin Flp